MSIAPAEAPENCPGTASADAGKASACAGCPNQEICASSSKDPDPDIELIRKRMSSIKKKVRPCHMWECWTTIMIARSLFYRAKEE